MTTAATIHAAITHQRARTTSLPRAANIARTLSNRSAATPPARLPSIAPVHHARQAAGVIQPLARGDVRPTGPGTPYSGSSPNAFLLTVHLRLPGPKALAGE